MNEPSRWMPYGAFGRLRVNVFVPGEAYNVIETDAEQDKYAVAVAEIFDRLIQSMSHSYKNAVNNLYFFMRKP